VRGEEQLIYKGKIAPPQHSTAHTTPHSKVGQHRQVSVARQPGSQRPCLAHLRASLPGPQSQAPHGQHTLQVWTAELPLAARRPPQAGCELQVALQAALGTVAAATAAAAIAAACRCAAC
jgi:hypothetical protein